MPSKQEDRIHNPYCVTVKLLVDVKRSVKRCDRVYAGTFIYNDMKHTFTWTFCFEFQCLEH